MVLDQETGGQNPKLWMKGDARLDIMHMQLKITVDDKMRQLM